MRTDRFRGALLSTLVIASLMVPAISLLFVGLSSAAPEGLTPRSPIYIESNDNFIPANGVVGGSGTENDPYIIENWDISAENAHGIEIRNTTAHFIIRNVYVHDGKDGINDGIYFDNVINGKIDNVASYNNWMGIKLSYSDNNIISNCIIEKYWDGIHLNYSSNNIIENCVAKDHVDGIRLKRSNNNLISNNVAGNNINGIYLSYSDNNLISNNILENNNDGIYLSWYSDNNLISNNILENNSDGIRLSNRSNSNDIVGNNLTNNRFEGISLGGSFYNNIVGNNVTSLGGTGISVWGSIGNTLSGNSITSGWGISLVFGGETTLTGNIITNSEHGIYLQFTGYNLISNNIVENCTDGIRLRNSTNNLIYRNNFINNENQAHDNSSNRWDNDYPSGGNYWSDYAGEDNYRGENQDIFGSDGIGDTPYYIPGDNNRDRYPLMEPWSPRVPEGIFTVSPAEVTVIDAPLGVPWTIPQRLIVWNRDNVGRTALVSVEVPPENAVRPGYEPIPNENWVRPHPSVIVIPENSFAEIQLTLDIPRWENLTGQRWEVWIPVERLPLPGEVVVVRPTVRIKIETMDELPPIPTEWDAALTATFSGGSDDAVFGVRPDATSGFDSAYDIPEPPPPVEPPYVQAYFRYPGNAPLPTRLHISCIPPGDIMEWPLRVSHRNGTDNITLSWSLENVPADYAVLLLEDENLVADMRAVDNYTFHAASGDFDFTIRVAVTVAWQLIETWTGTVSTPAEWQIIKIWAGAIKAPVVWQLIETWTGSVQVLPAWQLIETWTGTVSAPAEWQLTEIWTGTVKVSPAWDLIETWTGTVSAPAEWQLIEVWTGTVSAPVAAPPGKPSLGSPADGTITSDKTPTFDWSDVTEAENYDLLVDNDPDFSSPEIQMTVPVSTYTPTAELPEDNYSWKVRARDAANNVGDWSSIWTLLIKTIVRRVEASISPESKSGPPGETLTYTVTVVNGGDDEDTYDLTVTDALAWGVTVSPTSLTIAAGESDNATVSATIPEGTASGTEDEITVTATSRADLTVSDSATCIASAAAVRAVDVSISPENQSGAPGETLTYEVTVKNEGNVGDTYILSTAGAPDWLPRVENTSLTLYAGGVGETTLTVTIPPGASEGASMTVNVTAISVGDPTVVGSDTCRTIVKGAPAVIEVDLTIPLAISAFLIVAAILTAAYLLYVRPKKAARQRVLRGPRRIMLRGPRRTR